MKIAAAAVLLALTAGLAFCAWTLQNLRNEIGGLESKIASLENNTPATPAGTPAPTGAPAGSPGTPVAGDGQAPADTLGAAAASVTSTDDPAARKPDPAGAGATSENRLVTPEAWSEADRAAFEAAVAAALEKREQERDARREERQAEWLMMKLKENLKLTEQQAQAISKIVADTQASIGKLREQMTPENREEIRPQIQSTLQTADTQIKAYLTAEQVTAYDTMKQQAGGLFGGPGRGPGGGGGGGRRGGPNGGPGGD